MNLKIETDPSAAECGGPVAKRRSLLSFEEAVAAAIGAAVPSVGTETVSLIGSLGRVLAEDVIACAALPRFDHSAMDGFAVSVDDFVGTGPWILEVSSRVAAGDVVEHTSRFSMQATEIYTGGELPDGCNAVVIWERCSALGHGRVLVSSKPKLVDNIRRRGEDVSPGATVVSAGSLVTPHVAALLAALGSATVTVRPKIRAAVLTTGNELLPPGEQLGPGQIYDSNRHMVAGLLAAPWIDFVDLGMIGDDPTAIQEAIGTAAKSLDVLITSGGMSFGAADHVSTAMAAAGGSVDVLNVAMRPGKPAMIGRIGGCLFIGLPGNPMAAAVALAMIGMPAIKATAGIADRRTIWASAVAEFDCFKREGRTEFVPVAVEGRDGELPVLSLLGRGSSGSLLPMARATGVAMLRADTDAIRRGDIVSFHRL
ncbi:molybdopterin molybdotransferase MoeA [Rhizobium laguerreae]|uniref:molybdopterin molybdotransferase MoeA n=1 Tax=Rhizobium laguerreae TaxID=1076926 RepID=UPI001C90D96F|nr:gephyrin-like molybdotransferase Glp [Rhizobium laguerreae]MBY3246148.1 molybdopterin molybdotransferase MoeA [Rhizobium laguerreae]MBY3252773.1 molybdopterin molybdotransferase MoeA [Rhizobium laguerreae]